ncbi:hypothetical protein ACIOMM_36750 [Streptomyces sp. NPDC087908]|uniref:terpene synthase family protein n=1 Tax=Streptomyces sp. NPDC087908 TaxID=3365820 RepID=UPI00382D38EE
MPQDATFNIPFSEPPLAPELDEVRQESLRWLTGHGLLRSSEAEIRFSGWNLTELASRFFPQARGSELLLAANQQGFFFLFDDQFDAPEGLRDEAVAVTRQLMALAHQPPGTRANLQTPVTDAWTEIWAESCEGMSMSWRNRAIYSWDRYFTGNLVEALHRTKSPLDNLNEYLVCRRQTIGTGPVMDMSERVQGFEIPSAAFHTPQLQYLRDLATDAVTLMNDVASVEKEEHREDVLNSVLMLERTRRLNRSEAIQEVSAVLDVKLDEFGRVSSMLDSVYSVLQLSSESQKDVASYVHFALKSMIRGNYDWQLHSGRYNAESGLDMRPADLTNYLEDLVSPT